MPVSARQAAIEILGQWEKTREPIDQVRDAWLKCHPLLEARDRHLGMALVYGVLRQLGYLDRVIAGFSKHPLAGMKPLVRQALRIGLFQLLFLDRIPPAIAIHETVQAVKSLRQPAWLAGFVNAVLRAIDRGRAGLPDPAVAEADHLEFGVLNHPLWLVDRWSGRYGRDTALRICRHNNQIPDLCLLVNGARLTPQDFLARLAKAGIAGQPGRLAPAAVRLPGYRGLVQEIPGYDEGLFQVQDEAAQLVVELLKPFSPGSYLDGCAGLGGKTGQLAAALPAALRITAVEPHPGRRCLLDANLRRLNLRDRVEIVPAGLENLVDSAAGMFDRVLIDAPCSGLGVIRRQPDIRWARKPADLTRYRERQLALLTAAATLTAPGGVLVYATCSTEPEENEEVVTAFLQKAPGFALTDARELLPEAAQDLVDGQGFLRTLPTDGELAGFFAARLEKN